MASGAEFDQAERWLKVKFPKIGESKVFLESFQSEEHLSKSYSCKLEIYSHELEIDAKDVLGKSCDVTMKLPDDSTRPFHGLVWSFRPDTYIDLDPPLRRYHAELVPWFKLLSLRSDSRVFQEKTMPQIVEQVFKNAGYTDYKLSLKGQYAKVDYCVQYRETDYDFVTRLLQDSGIFYYFQHEAGKNTMVLADAASGYVDCKDPSSPFAVGATEEEWDTIVWWRQSQQLSPASVVNWGYDFENPSKTLETKEKSKLKAGVVSKGELYEFADTGLTHGFKVADSKTNAVARMEAFEARAIKAEGKSLKPTFVVGGKFKLTDHPIDAETNKRYAITAIKHQIAEPNPLLPQLETAEERKFYSNQFECVPADTPYRPFWTLPRPRLIGPHTAKVTGPQGAEIHSDKYGRVRVQFHWDREGKFDDKSSSWIRVAQSWASNKFGFQFIPRVGDEVLVDFIDGDPNQPIVTGSVYNAENMPPYDPVEKGTHSGIKTKSSDKGKAKNFNELRFEDKIGEELVYFHAERNFERVVENDDKLKVGFDAKDKGSQTIDIFFDRTTTIDKGKDVLTLKTGDRIITLDKGNQTTTIKQGNFKLAVKAGAIDIEAAKSITLKCGGSTVKIDPMSITLDSTKITAKAKLKAEVKGTLVDVVAAGMLTLKGGLVKLN